MENSETSGKDTHLANGSLDGKGPATRLKETVEDFILRSE